MIYISVRFYNVCYMNNPDYKKILNWSNISISLYYKADINSLTDVSSEFISIYFQYLIQVNII